MNRERRRHPDGQPVDPATCETAAQDYTRRGGQARVAALTPDEHSALGTRGSDARWAAHRAELAAQGKKPRQTPAPMPPAVLAYWKDVVKAEQPDRVWKSAMELKRAAIKRAKQEAARLTVEHAKRGGQA
ncbi:hypothetical protein [Microbacterium lacticum]